MDTKTTPKNKVLYDIVHGYIEIDKNTEMIINHPLFQRLKNIKQQASYHLFPSANHTRFEHSLGVMKLAEDAFRHYADELEEAIVDDEKISDCNNFCEHIIKYMTKKKKMPNNFDLKNKQIRETYKHWLLFHLKYAALLHDIGHAPLSHIGEHFYVKKNIINEIQKIIDTEKNKEDKDKIFLEYYKLDDKRKINLNDFKIKDKNSCDWHGNTHEWMSCYIILKEFVEPLKQIYENKRKQDAKEFNVDIIELPQLDVDFGFIIRIITGNIYMMPDGIRTCIDIGNGIIQLINGNTIDCDRLDYALRDNFMVGGIGAFVDTKRIFNSLTFDKEKFDIIFKKGAISALKNYIDCRDNLYMWVCNHHLVVYTDFLYQESLEQLFKMNPSIKNDYFSCDSIINRMPTDNEIHCLLREYWNKLKNCKRNDEDKYLFNLLDQLFQRNKKLTSLYKTRTGYIHLLDDMNRGGKNIKDVNDKFSKIIINKKSIDEINKTLQFDKGDFFIIKKANKDFLKNEIKSIKIVDNEGNPTEKKITSLDKYISYKEHEEITDVTIFIYYRSKSDVEKEKIKGKITKAIENYIDVMD